MKKSDHCLADWKYERGDWALCSVEESPGDICVIDYDTGKINVLTRKEAWDPHTTLGVVMTLSGDATYQMQELKKRTGSMVVALNRAKLRNTLVLLAYRCNILPAIAYPGFASMLEEEHFTEIQGQALELFLHGHGLAKNTKRMIGFADKQYGAMGCTS